MQRTGGSGIVQWLAGVAPAADRLYVMPHRGLNVLERIRRLIYPIEGTAEPARDDTAILLCEFRGVIRDGSSGNSAVDEMAGTIERALARGGFRAVLLDISGVRYTFGDHAFGLLMNLRHRGLDLALVVSEQCSQLGTFAERIGGWTVWTNRGEALQKLR
jgi:hypothetical protein